MTIREKYDMWMQKATKDADLRAELEQITGDDEAVRDRFYQELAFGTAGLRGVIGAGDNRMNVYVVCKATQGLANYLNAHYDNASVAIAYDSRIKSDLFAREAACVLAANGVTVHLYPRLAPVPLLSFAVRYCGCQAGVMITASHNPAEYNGYKCYGADGCQMTDAAADEVTGYIRALDMFEDVKTADYDVAVADGRIRLIGDEVPEAYYEQILRQQVNPGVCAEANLKIIYTPLHGAGNIPVREVLRRIGAAQVRVVAQQELPDGNFPTAPYPNPEIREAFNCALDMAHKEPADLILATDPDSDRVGIAVYDGEDYTLMSGNQVGCLLLDYILSCRAANGTLPKDPVVCKTIVTSNLAAAIAKKYGCELRDLLTGFKYIGEQIGLLELKGEEDRFVFGFEESYGYLAGAHVRDKDAVVASMLIAEMASYYHTKGVSLLDRLQQLYAEHGVYRHSLVNVKFEGEQGMLDMRALMDSLRQTPPAEIGGLKVLSCADYEKRERTDFVTGETVALTLPRSNVLSYALEGNAGLIFRPSGTEPKIKAYITAIGADLNKAIAMEETLRCEAKRIIGK